MKAIPVKHAMNAFAQNGFETHRGVFSETELERFREESDRVAGESGSACVRHVRDRSRLFDSVSASEKLSALLPRGHSPVRSLLFDKIPEENWPVAWHQDLTIAVGGREECEGYGPWTVKDGAWHVQPPVSLLELMITARIHLDETPADNGALLVSPGSHRRGRIPLAEIAQTVEASTQVCECRAGDVLLMSPLLLHASRRSRVPRRRRVLHFEFTPLAALDQRLTWHERVPASI